MRTLEQGFEELMSSLEPALPNDPAYREKFAYLAKNFFFSGANLTLSNIAQARLNKNLPEYLKAADQEITDWINKHSYHIGERE